MQAPCKTVNRLTNYLSSPGSASDRSVPGADQGIFDWGVQTFVQKDFWTFLMQITSPPHPLPPFAAARYNSLAAYRLLGFYL